MAKVLSYLLARCAHEWAPARRLSMWRSASTGMTGWIVERECRRCGRATRDLSIH